MKILADVGSLIRFAILCATLGLVIGFAIACSMLGIEKKAMSVGDSPFEGMPTSTVSATHSRAPTNIEEPTPIRLGRTREPASFDAPADDLLARMLGSPPAGTRI
jgi:hypothetical protein